MITKILIVLVVTTLIDAKPTSVGDDDSEIVLLHVIFRHGARITDNFYRNDPYQNETFEPEGLGGLTNVGKMSCYKLGQFLRAQYANFIGDTYSRLSLDVRSTHYHRVRMSALVVLAGLFPPKGEQIWNPDMLWLPIPVDYKNPEDEDVFHRNREFCQYKDTVLKTLYQRPGVKEKYIDPYKTLFDKVANGSGNVIKDPLDLLHIFFILKTEADLGLPLPSWTKDIYPEEIERASSQYYEFENSDFGIKKIDSGYLLRNILNETHNYIIGENLNTKVYIYSAHEHTIGYLLAALNYTLDYIPPYSTALIFEVHKKDNQYFMKVGFKNETYGNKIIGVPVGSCEDELCPINTFRAINAHILPDIEMQEACDTLVKSAVPNEK